MIIVEDDFGFAAHISGEWSQGYNSLWRNDLPSPSRNRSQRWLHEGKKWILETTIFNELGTYKKRHTVMRRSEFEKEKKYEL